MDIEKTEFQRQLDSLLQKEKTARLNNEFQESVKLLKQIVQFAWDMKEYETMFQQIISLSKKRGQVKKAQIEMVKQCMLYISQLDDQNLKIKLIQTLKEVCDKKIFLEVKKKLQYYINIYINKKKVEYARCCLLLVKLKEDDNEINEAAKILQEVQVETYGSMDRREKLEFILYQMKIMIKKQDYVRLIIISKKVNPNNINDKNLVDLKIQYYAYLVVYYNHENKYMEACNSYKQILDTLNDKNNQDIQFNTTLDFGFDCTFQNIFENMISFLIITKHTHEQVQLLNQLTTKYKHILERYSNLKHVVEQYLLEELISTNPSEYNIGDIWCFSKAPNHEKHLQDFRKQLIQHNIRIVNKYYENISFARLANLLNITENEAESELCEMINEKLAFCKIDRLDKIVNFRLKKSENDILNSWSNDINQLLALIDSTSNLIKREEELYKN
ncbi:26S proteasome protein, macropain, putative [Ichthyophthirius multifiliis]|uniref:26S proteasome protein, macropain, putative n=1 Tax=Ichthyophthirius multifiliis TaxID=5932 RepID=G0R0E0_ICHMU|nr:26S proteasome protein, macropain, putative [Ichthyophthirius multifiliis]EGR29077.1 26S proteasome protein, macropain, putative [Ichthyophthirius multifiliis]|eukprot:XP_004030313.1 26S proteasome protein, macropain, putative [Ichthyophthirius multifiliis]